MHSTSSAFRRAVLVFLAMVSAAPMTPARAQSFPAKPIRIVVGFPAGNTLDVVSRLVAEHLRVKLGQTVIVENKPGANGILAAQEVARAAPDGYTLLASNSSGMTVNPQVYRKANLKLADFAPLSMIVSAPLILVTNAGNERTTSMKTVGDFVALARARPEELRCGTGGPGNLTGLAFQMLGNSAGFKVTYVPYKGTDATRNGLLGKEIDCSLDTPVAVPQVAAGRLTALAVTGASRWRDLPAVPTIAESGFPGFDVTYWLALLAPARTPPAVIQTLYRAIASIRDDPNLVKQLYPHGTLELMEPAKFGERMHAESAGWGEIIKRDNIQLD